MFKSTTDLARVISARMNLVEELIDLDEMAEANDIARRARSDLDDLIRSLEDFNLG